MTDSMTHSASRGIGLYASAALLQAGCSLVIITARDANNLSMAAKSLNDIPNISGQAVAIPANVGHTDQIQQFVKDVETEVVKHGKKGVDILIANAASSWGGPFEDFEDWKSQKTLDLNVRGVFNLVRLYVFQFLPRSSHHGLLLINTVWSRSSPPTPREPTLPAFSSLPLSAA
jgi:NAD(P)-dependent dehydrogenase (short-subunit alcohol dehydrogenase family)